MGKFPFKRPRIISKKFPELDSSIEGVTKSLNDLVFGYHEQVQNALSKKHWLMAFSSIALLLVLGSFLSQYGKADSSIFYPETCLGGWINPDNAQGEQQTTSNGDETQFTKENSALLLENTNAEIYCGNFKGKFDTATKPTKIIVALALTKGYEIAIENIVENTQKIATTSLVLPILETASSTATSILILASSSENSLSTTTESASEASTTTVTTATAIPGSLNSDSPSVLRGVIESLKDTVHDIFNTGNDKKTQTDTIVVPLPISPEVIPAEQTPSSPLVPEPATVTPLSPTSYLPSHDNFLTYFIGTVFAEEVITTSTTTKTEIVQTLDTPSPEEKTENVVTALPENEKVLSATTSTLIVSTTTSDTSNVASTTIDSSASTSLNVVIGTSTNETIVTTTESQHTQNNFLEVFYTFDGEVWKSLGLLNEISMKYRTFEIPVNASTSWSDMSKLQVKIEARKHETDTPVVYLDGIKVEVLYEGAPVHSHPDFARDTILKDETIDGVRIVTIINSDNTKEEVWYMYLEGEVVTSTIKSASSTFETSTSTVSGSTTKSKPIAKDTYQDINVSSTTSASSTLLATTTSIIKPVIPKNIWFKFEGKAKGMSGQELRENIKKNDEKSIDPTESERPPDFLIDTIKRIKSTFLKAVVVQVQKENTDELWLYNIEDGTQEKLQSGTTTSVSSTYPLGFKGGYLFWLSQDEARVYAYDFISKGVLEKVVPNFDGAKGERAEVAFSEIPWKVIVSANGFLFYSEATGEVFSDDDGSVTEMFRQKLKLDTFLNEEEMSKLNFTFSGQEAVVTDTTKKQDVIRGVYQGEEVNQ